MLRRPLGSSGLTVSQVCYGTMRLRDQIGLRPASLLCLWHDHGVDTHHSSHEYDSHPLYLAALSEVRATGRSFEHIVKLSAPSFDDSQFSGKALRSLVTAELRSLGADHLASVQWLVRTPDVNDDLGRVELIRRQAEEINDTIDTLISSGDVANVSIFPYSTEFARHALEATSSDTLCTYLNVLEMEYAVLLSEVQSFIAIRPLGGGLVTRARISEALTFPLLHPNVASVVVSANARAHVEEVVGVTANLTPDESLFNSTIQLQPG